MKTSRFGGVGGAAPRYFADQMGRDWIPIGCNLWKRTPHSQIRPRLAFPLP